MEENRMTDFSPDTEKNDSSKLNTQLRDTDTERSGFDEEGTGSAFSVPEAGSGMGSKADSGAEDADGSGESAEAAGEAAGDNTDTVSEDAETPGTGEAGDTPSGQNAGDKPGASGMREKSGRLPAASAPGSGSRESHDLNGSREQADISVPEISRKAEHSKAATYRDKILRHKKRRYRRTIMLVVFVMALLVTAVILWMRRGYTRAELIRISAIASEDSASYENLGGNVVQYGNSGAVCVDQRGNTLWNVSYEMQQPITSVSGDVIAIANRSGYYVYVMNSQGLMGTIHTTLPIHGIAAAENGEVAVIMNDTKATWVRLYTAEGREIAYLVRTMSENGYPIAAAVSPDGETLCLSSVSMSNAAVKTNISFYNFGKAGQKANDHLIQHSDFIDEVIPYLHYIDNTTCVCVSDKQLFCFWSTILHSSGSSYAQLPDNTLGVFCGDSFVGILSTNIKGDTQYTLDLYNKRGKKAGSVNFTMQYTDIDIAGDKIYIHNEQECQIFTISGRCLFNGKFERPIRAMIPGAGLSDLLVVTDGEVDNVRLH